MILMKINPAFPTPAGLMLLALLLAGPALAADADYGYPIENPYAATVIGTPSELQPPRPAARDMRYRRIDLTVFPDRQMPYVLWFNSALRNGMLYQSYRAPLLFIIAGTGGSYRSTRARNVAAYFYQAGFHVVNLSSPTHPNFISAASSSHYPGSLQDDAEDLYRVMQLIRDQVQDDIDISDYYLLGYSLGGAQAAFITRLDQQRKQFNFRKTLLINPPVNLYRSVRLLDEMLARAAPTVEAINALITQFSEQLAQTFRQRGDVGSFTENFQVEDALYLAYRNIQPTAENLQGLIGAVFRLAVANMTFVADVMTNAGYIKPKNLVLYPTDSLTDYEKVAQGVSFEDYFRDLFLPFYLSRHRGADERDIIWASGLESIEDFLKRTPTIGVMTNQDDIILAPGDLDYLRRIFGSRLKVYPRGGHLGNMEYRDNVAHMLGFFQ